MENFIFSETDRLNAAAEHTAAVAAEEAAIAALNQATESCLDRTGFAGIFPDAEFDKALEERLQAREARIAAGHNLHTANLQW
jgi:hypothetical protein